MEQHFTVLGCLVLITLILAIARQLSEQRNIYELPDSFGATYSRHGWDRGIKENFESSSPADFRINSDPYNLIENQPRKPEICTMTAERCYNNNFYARIEKTGNYNQFTNNFKHAKPDSCSSPLTEFVGNFY